MTAELAGALGARRAGMLDRPGGHRIAWWESGNPDGLPIVVLHGGPGGGSEAIQRTPLDPAQWRIFQFDQRGCGHSTPFLELAGNTTSDLVGDVEALREHLGVERWAVLGGSWGTTLALAYGQAHPQRVLGFLLRAVFLCRDADIDWVTERDGAARLRPDGFATFAGAVAAAPGESLMAAYGRAFAVAEPAGALRAARAWAEWEDSLCHLLPEQRTPLGDELVLALARLEHHYMSRRGFLRESQLLDEMAALGAAPAVIVHGRYDLCCPVEQAWALHAAWPGSDLRIVEDASHSATDQGIIDGLREGAVELARRIGAPAPMLA